MDRGANTFRIDQMMHTVLIKGNHGPIRANREHKGPTATNKGNRDQYGSIGAARGQQGLTGTNMSQQRPIRGRIGTERIPTCISRSQQEPNRSKALRD